MVCVTASVAGSIRVTVAPTVLATQIAPAPLVMLPGPPPTIIRSTSAPEPGSTRDTFPWPGSATQTEPLPPLTALGAPVSLVACTSWSEAVFTATRPLAPARVAWPAAGPRNPMRRPATRIPAPAAARAATRARRGRDPAAPPTRAGLHRAGLRRAGAGGGGSQGGFGRARSTGGGAPGPGRAGGRVLAQDRALEPLQGGAWFQAELADHQL